MPHGVAVRVLGAHPHNDEMSDNNNDKIYVDFQEKIEAEEEELRHKAARVSKGYTEFLLGPEDYSGEELKKLDQKIEDAIAAMREHRTAVRALVQMYADPTFNIPASPTRAPAQARVAPNAPRKRPRTDRA